MKDQHQFTFTQRKQNARRHAHHRFKWVANESSPHRVELFGCPSCWFHCFKNFHLIKDRISNFYVDEEDTGSEDISIDPEDGDDYEEDCEEGINDATETNTTMTEEDVKQESLIETITNLIREFRLSRNPADNPTLQVTKNINFINN